MQAYISESLSGLDFRKKYNLTDYTNLDAPLVMFGMYREVDIETYLRHRGPLTLVWQGMDAKDCHWITELKLRPNTTHYAISHWISDRLAEYGINSFYAPISATIGKANPVERGNCIYFYTSNLSKSSANYYGSRNIEKIRQRTGLEVIVATYETYTKEQLQDVYAKCFINVRLTDFDGCPNTNLEMGLLGRRSIFNGNIPGSIRWHYLDDACESIMREYYHRHEDNSHIAEMMDIYVNSPNLIFK